MWHKSVSTHNHVDCFSTCASHAFHRSPSSVHACLLSFLSSFFVAFLCAEGRFMADRRDILNAAQLYLEPCFFLRFAPVLAGKSWKGLLSDFPCETHVSNAARTKSDLPPKRSNHDHPPRRRASGPDQEDLAPVQVLRDGTDLSSPHACRRFCSGLGNLFSTAHPARTKRPAGSFQVHPAPTGNCCRIIPSAHLRRAGKRESQRSYGCEAISRSYI